MSTENTLPLGVEKENTPPNAPQSTQTNVSDQNEQSTVTPPPTPPQPPQATPKQTLSQEAADELALAQFEETNRALFPTEKMLSVMIKFADYCVQTQQMPSTINTTAKAIMVFQAGRELGISPMKALYSFYFVNNKLTMYGPTVIERIRMWARIEYGECNDKEANITIIRKDDGTRLSSRVTMADLDERGLTSTSNGKKDTFRKHPRTMLLYKAIGEIVRHIVPEAVGSMAVEGDWNDDAKSEIENDKGRVGKVHDVVVEPENGEIPTVAQIVRKYDLDVLKARCVELEIEVPEKPTKSKLAQLIVDKLKEQK